MRSEATHTVATDTKREVWHELLHVCNIGDEPLVNRISSLFMGISCGINYRIRALICPMTIKMRCDGHGAQWDAARRHALRSGVGP